MWIEIIFYANRKTCGTPENDVFGGTCENE